MAPFEVTLAVVVTSSGWLSLVLLFEVVCVADTAIVSAVGS